MIVVDLGCHTYPAHPADESIHALVQRFQPAFLFGFDPHPDLTEGVTFIHGVPVLRSRKAAWTHNGYVSLIENGLRTKIVSDAESAAAAPCFDLVSFLHALPGPITLKLDVEGSEYTLLPYLNQTGADSLLHLLLVEWHGPAIEGLRCEVEEW